MHYNVSVQSENCFAAAVGTSTPPMVHGSRSPLRKQHDTKTRTEHEERLHDLEHKQQAQEEIGECQCASLLVLFFSCKDYSLQSAVLGSIEHASKLHESTLLEKALVAVPQHALQISVVPFIAPSDVPQRIPERRSAVQVQHQTVLRHEQSHPQGCSFISSKIYSSYFSVALLCSAS